MFTKSDNNSILNGERVGTSQLADRWRLNTDCAAQERAEFGAISRVRTYEYV